MAPCWRSWASVGWMEVLVRVWDWPVVVAINAVREGLLLYNIIVELLVNFSPGHGGIGGSHVAEGCIVHKPG